MIYDSIKNIDRYRNIPQLYEGLLYLRTITKENFPKQRVVLDGKKKFAVPKLYRTKSPEEAHFEVHRTQADIHYMVEGVEGVQTADSAEMELQGTFSEERDWGEYTGVPDGTYWIRPGYFAATFPGEAHKTGLCAGRPQNIRKLVYKYVVSDPETFSNS